MKRKSWVIPGLVMALFSWTCALAAVVAFNQVGQANFKAQEVISHSSEGVPLEAPSNFTVIYIINERTAILSWNPVSPDSVQGRFRGYKIETWTNNDGESRAREMISKASKALVNKFVPNSVNYVRVRVFNSAFEGPASETLTLKTPEGRPGPVDYFEAFPLGSSAFYLIWKQPLQPNGVLTGYKISYETVKESQLGSLIEREPPITDPFVTKTKLTGLQPNTKYRIHISATTRIGAGDDYYIERTTPNTQSSVPDKPHFIWKQIETDDRKPAIRLVWHPNINGSAGSHFFVQYRRKGETIYESSNNEYFEDFIIIRGLETGVLYEFRVVTVDGPYSTPSDPEEVELFSIVQSPPLITKQPPPDELLFQVAQRQDGNDKPFVIECEAEGEPAPKYKWIKNGFEFQWQTYDDRISQQPGRGTLVITSPRDVDIGQYQCFASNEFGTATSNSVFVRKSDLNSFKEEPPHPVSAQEGQPFSLRCQPPDGWPKPSVYWMMQSSNGALRSINSSRMTVDPEGTLWFSNVTKEDSSDDFVYACSATSLFRNEYKLGNKVYLDVVPTGSSAAQNRHVPVQQYVSRKNSVALRGKNIELWCVFGGTPLPQIRWSKQGGALPPGRTTYTNYGKTLVIKSVDFEDKGNYECEASNGVGLAQSYSIQLDVKAAPYFTVEPEIFNGAEDETAEFRCDANGSPAPEIKWIFNGKPIEEAPVNPRRKVFPNRIVIERLQKSDTANYGCNATNSIGYVYKDVYLNVLALPPEIEDPPKDVATVDGLSVNLTCKVFGSPKPLVKWIRDGLELTGGRYRVMENGDLEIRDVTFTDAGVYSCHASNKFGSVVENGTLIVKERTVIKDGPEDYEVTAGQTATFRCNAVADSSLNLTIDWLHQGELIDFEQEPRFVQSQDSSLTITKTTELDTGEYTCRARTILDSTTANATLIVQDVPNRPKLIGIQCNNRDAMIDWTPSGDNRAPILTYTIQYNTSFTPDSWEVSFENVSATETRFKVEMSPWANYTFRVIARNKIGPSLPSDHSKMCLTPPDVPYKNPDNVEGRGSSPTNLVVSWNPMPEIEHNARNFHYRVYWKRDIPGEEWNIEDVNDWRQSSIVVPNQPTFKRYRLKVVAFNQVGQANVAAQEVIGYSGEDVPLEAPSNFTVNDIVDERSAILSWNPVSPDSVQGHFRGYKIETWTDNDGESRAREMVSNASKAFVNKFVPHTVNYVRVRVINSAFKGPASEILTLKTPEGRPGPVDYFEAIPLGSSAFYLIWKQPQQPNGVLTGYKISYETVKETQLGSLIEREPPITDPFVTKTKLAGLQPNTKYRLHISATTRIGAGDDYFIERTTQNTQSSVPDKPHFIWKQIETDDRKPAIRVVWHPNVNGSPGSHFYVQYRRKGETIYESSKNEYDEDFIVIRGLETGILYEFRVVTVDGPYSTPSDPEEVELYAIDGPFVQARETVATAGWFIGMMLALALLLLVLVLVCIIKRNRGGKYAVHEREATHGRKDYNEDAGFHEYSQPVASSRTHSKGSLSSEAKVPPESDTDSMAEYGEGEAEGMNEDGSFIGQYGKKRSDGSSAFATLV